jgi:hypothetical protein
MSAAACSIAEYVCIGACRLLRQLGEGKADLSNTEPGGLRNCITT